MTLTYAQLEELRSHWAVRALDESIKARADEVVNARVLRGAVSALAQIDFQEHPNDDEILVRAATAYEIVAAEGIRAVLYPSGSDSSESQQQRTQAAASQVYEYRRVLPIPSDTEQLILHVLHLSAVAYCGDRWAEQRRWLNEHREVSSSLDGRGESWDRRILYRIYECWVRLVRKNGWEDLESISSLISGLRADQKEYEAAYLTQVPDMAARAAAYRLIALYNWARATELLSIFMLQGEPHDIAVELDRHFEAGQQAAATMADITLEMLLTWLHAAARRMAGGSIWQAARMITPRGQPFVEHLLRDRGMFELLPPQRAALQQQGLLDPARRAVVVDLPTSGGKTALAEFRILQALNQFDASQGWVAYVAPTRALVAQVTRRLRRDFGALNVNVEQLSGAVELDEGEAQLLASQDARQSFHILVTTPEKLQFVIRNKSTPRPLALAVVDEAHKIEDEERGLRIELLLATMKRECSDASFLLLMPYVPNARDLAMWLSPDSGIAISLGATAWRPNERVVGIYHVTPEQGRGNWSLRYETLVTSPRTIHLAGQHRVGGIRPLSPSYSRLRGSLTLQTAAMARVLAERGTSIAVARTVDDAWSMAREIAQALGSLRDLPEEIALVQRFLATEISEDFELIDLLNAGVGVHHSGLSDETRSLVEWLAEIGALKVLCSTTTITDGINFPVSSVFLSTWHLPVVPPRDMSPRDFWNLAGRAGRMDQSSVGVVGIAAGSDPQKVRKFVGDATQALVSRLVTLIKEAEETAGQLNLDTVILSEQWQAFRGYVAHLWNEKQNLSAVIGETEQILRNTYGYTSLQGQGDEDGINRARRLLEATRRYAVTLSNAPETAIFADATGFAPEGVRSALSGLYGLEKKLSTSDWIPDTLFADQGTNVLSRLIGVMMRIPELRESLSSIAGPGYGEQRLAEITRAWVNGQSLKDIAVRYFSDPKDAEEALTKAISRACRAIYGTIANYETWGLAALSKLPGSGISFELLKPEERRRINNLAAMIYYGVSSDAAILMRMQSVPRSAAEKLGAEFARRGGTLDQANSPRLARDFLLSLTADGWQEAVPDGSNLSGEDYKVIWSKLSGEEAK